MLDRFLLIKDKFPSVQEDIESNIYMESDTVFNDDIERDSIKLVEIDAFNTFLLTKQHTLAERSDDLDVLVNVFDGQK